MEVVEITLKLLGLFVGLQETWESGHGERGGG